MRSTIDLGAAYVTGGPEPLYYFRSLDTNVLIRLARSEDVGIEGLLDRVRRETQEIQDAILGSDSSIGEGRVGVDVLTAYEFVAALRETANAPPGTPLHVLRTLLNRPYAAVLDTKIIAKEASDKRVLVGIYDHGKLAHENVPIQWTSGYGSFFEFGPVFSGVANGEENIAGTYFTVGGDLGANQQRLFLAGIDGNTEYLDAKHDPKALADICLVIPVGIKLAAPITRLE